MILLPVLHSRNPFLPDWGSNHPFNLCLWIQGMFVHSENYWEINQLAPLSATAPLLAAGSSAQFRSRRRFIPPPRLNLLLLCFLRFVFWLIWWSAAAPRRAVDERTHARTPWDSRMRPRFDYSRQQASLLLLLILLCAPPPSPSTTKRPQHISSWSQAASS